MEDEDYYRGEIFEVETTEEENELSLIQAFKKARKELLASHSTPHERLKSVIRSKAKWEEKVFDDAISKKYKLEAKEKGMPADVVDCVLGQLREEASYILRGRSTFSAAGASSSSSSSSRASVVVSETSPFDFVEYKKAVSAVQARLAVGEGLKEPLEEKENGVWVVDKVVPQELRELLESRLDAIANLPNKDFHPNSNDQVQDLIHPSLFTYRDSVPFALVRLTFRRRYG